MLDFRIETFLAVCETKSYTQAARHLNITQPAVSQHIAHLERVYGVALFARCGRRLVLTPAGELLRTAGETMAHDERMLRERMAQAAGRNARLRLHIGMTLTAGEYVVAAPLARYLVRHPEVDPSVRSGDTAQLLAELAHGEVDCAFIEGLFDASSLASDTFDRQRLVCVCSPDHPLAGRRVELVDLLRESLIVREPGSGSRAVLERALAGRNLSLASFERLVEASSVGVCRILAQGGVGITFLYEAAVREALRAGLLCSIELAGVPIEHDIAFVRLPGSIFESQLVRFLRELVGCAEELRSEASGPVTGPSASRGRR